MSNQILPTVEAMLRHLLAAVVALAATAGAGLMASPAPAEPSRNADLPWTTELRRNTEAVHTLGVPAVQASATDRRRTADARVGVADIRTGRPIPPNGAFRIASTAKTMTATVILQLVGQGRL